MKYYIPISNLNLDNILQSECILPMTHYAQRCSGYKTFERLEEFRMFDNIILFKYPVQFQINETDRYNYPVLIELEDDKQTSDLKEVQDGVYFCNHRLNLAPTNCRIYFFSDNAYKLTLINTQSNKAIKYFKEYKIYPMVSMLNLKRMPNLDNIAPIENAQFEDTVLDKQKGLLYAFLLGNKMSVNKDLARQLKLTQELYNILTNLISSPSSITAFGGKLETLLNDYKAIDAIERKNNDEFQTRLKSELRRFYFLKDCLIEFLQKVNCWDMVFKSLCKQWNCDFLPDMSEREFTLLRNKIESRTLTAVVEYSRSIPNPNLDCLHIVGDYIEFSNVELINIVIKYIITNTITPEKLSANRMEVYMAVMKNIVAHLKTKIGESNWEGSKEQTYVNGLYAFINDPAIPFALNSIDNIELKSIAAFILRGQSFKDCVAYLRMNETEDYRYTLALWGCLYGYMELNKEALSDVLSMDNYRMVYRKMFGSDMTEISPNAIMRISSPVDSNGIGIDYEIFKFILDEFKYKNTDCLLKSLSEYKVTEDSVKDKLNEILGNKPFKNSPAQCENARKALEIYLSRNDKTKTKDALTNSGLSKPKQKSILTKFGFSEPKQKKSKKRISGQEIPFPETDQDGMNAETNKLPELKCFSGLDIKAKSRLDHNWQFTSSIHPNNRYEHIRFFINLCKKEGEGRSNSPTPLIDVFTKPFAELVEKELKSYYGI